MAAPYGTQWRHYRLAHLRANPLCAFCLEAGRPVPATVVDHIERHDGTTADPRFFDPSNFQSLCKSCHDRTKQQIDRSGRARAYGVDGVPLELTTPRRFRS